MGYKRKTKVDVLNCACIKTGCRKVFRKMVCVQKNGLDITSELCWAFVQDLSAKESV